MDKQIHHKIVDEIDHSFPNVNSAAVEVLKCMINFIPNFYWAYGYLSMLVFNLIHINKMGPSNSEIWSVVIPYSGV